ncbi:MAG: hypothetical protein DLM64_06120 [Solirubrobacterales bacterium]|nr:MAG: hypothetical protein DLM64_06120 [Solirubrobacterales bacterium]
MTKFSGLSRRFAAADARDLALAVRGLRGVKAAGRIERRSSLRHAVEQRQRRPVCTLNLPRRPRSRERGHGRTVRRTPRSTRADPSGDDDSGSGEPPGAVAGRRGAPAIGSGR